MEKISREIYINSSMCSNRIALIEKEKLVELYIDFPSHTKMVGNIYKGLVQNIIPGIQAAFIDVGQDTNAFLPLAELENDDSYKNIVFEKNDKKINKNKKIEDLKIGDSIMVQVVKEPFAGKGARITTEISIPGALIVLIPNQNYIGISILINFLFSQIVPFESTSIQTDILIDKSNQAVRITEGNSNIKLDADNFRNDFSLNSTITKLIKISFRFRHLLTFTHKIAIM